MRSLKIPEGEAIEARMVSRSIENAQRKVEARNFDIRKQLLEYDDVANDQRKVIYQQRNELLETSDISQTISHIRSDVLGTTVQQFMPARHGRRAVGRRGRAEEARERVLHRRPVGEWIKADETLDSDGIARRVIEMAASRTRTSSDRSTARCCTTTSAR
jgi:preprotein translocase subunit SecA